MKKGTFIGVSLGVGSLENITIAAIGAIVAADVIAYPFAKNRDESRAMDRLRSLPVDLSNKEFLPLHLPMATEGLHSDWMHAAETVMRRLNEGSDVAFVGIGDLLLYSTFYYVERIVRDFGHKARIIPGITSFQTLAAGLVAPIAHGKERILILPGDSLEAEEINSYDTLVFLKKPRNAELMKRLARTHDIVIGSELGTEKEHVVKYHSKKTLDSLPYFSLAIARKRH